MKKYLLLHVGFTKPTDEIMKAWQAWFRSIEKRQIDQGGLGRAREVSRTGSRELASGMESLTGYNIIEAESLDEAEKIDKACPAIASVRVYEIRSM